MAHVLKEKKHGWGGGKDCQERNDDQKREERLVREEGWLEEQHGQETAYRKNITMEGD